MNLVRQSHRGAIPFRAAYALERAFLSAPDRFVPYCTRFLNDFCEITHPGAWRHYGKLMALLLKKTRSLFPGKRQTASGKPPCYGSWTRRYLSGPGCGRWIFFSTSKTAW
ncbi:MAG: hypothetical protein LUD68_06880, partial [Rikenellaceae bacterium]|nr:hypothetical protein [Rikenellaceae bacterium]